MDETELNALNFLKNKEYDKAANLYLKLALKNPTVEKYFITAANCYDAIGDKKTALSLYKKSLEINPTSTTALLNISTIYYEIKKYEKSLKFSNKVLEINPDNFSAILNIANTYYANKEYNEALKFYEKLYELNPNSYNAIANIANTCYNLNQFIRAIEFSKKAIEKRPNSVEPYIVAGNSYAELLKKDDAAILLKKAATIAPNSEWVCNSIACLYMKMGNYKQGLAYAWKLFSLKNNITADDHINFGYILYEAHDENYKELVEKYLDLWTERYPNNPIVHHICCALRNVQEIQTSDLGYIKTIFDNFAPSFDNILTELDYCVPQSIAEFIKENLKTKLFKKQQILDLGCGTGLCSEELKKIFPNEEYYGVDISDKMLNEASKKNIYKELYVDDITNFLTKNNNKYHVIIAGDVLTYMGDLKPLTKLLTKSTAFNGYLCFSISKNIYNKNEYFLTPSGRFVHNISHVLRQLKYCGFEVVKTEEKVLRREGGKDVLGYIILVKKELEVVFE